MKKIAPTTPGSHPPPPRNSKDKANRASRGLWWIRVGMALLPDAAITLAASIGVATQHWHPIAALVSSICLFGLWVSVTFLNPLLAYSSEVFFTNNQTWEKLCYGEAGFQAIFTILYAVMIGYAAKGVHEWRMEKARKHTNIELSPRKVSESSSMDQNVYADARV